MNLYFLLEGKRTEPKVYPKSVMSGMILAYTDNFHIYQTNMQNQTADSVSGCGRRNAEKFMPEKNRQSAGP
jgi:hypothetical protein